MTPLNELTTKTNPNLKEIKPGFHFVNLTTILDPAVSGNYGVAAINIRSKYILDAALEAAFEEKSPLILEVAESEAGYANMQPDRLVNLATVRIEKLINQYEYTIPICLHMDHVKKGMHMVNAAIKAGFSSVASDNSLDELDENIKKTSEAIDACHPLGITVEGEIGEIGAAKALQDPDLKKNILKYVPTVEEASKFSSETGIDVFAGFFGNGHGKYKDIPEVTWERIAEIRDAINIPIVMHGGAYLQTNDYDLIGVFQQAIKMGCYKFNYATKISDIFKKYITKDILSAMEKSKGKDNWRKALGEFEDQIDAMDEERLFHAVIEMKYHIKMMMKYAWGSSGKAE